MFKGRRCRWRNCRKGKSECGAGGRLHSCIFMNWMAEATQSHSGQSANTRSIHFQLVFCIAKYTKTLFFSLSLFSMGKWAIWLHLMCGRWAMLDSEKRKRRGKCMGIWKFTCYQHLQIDSMQRMMWINHSNGTIEGAVCAGRQRKRVEGGRQHRISIEYVDRYWTDSIREQFKAFALADFVCNVRIQV